jgi:subtilase family serine protease
MLDIFVSAGVAPKANIVNYMVPNNVAYYIDLFDSDNHELVRWMPEVWVMPVGATKDQQEAKTVADISMEAMRRGYNIATRNHCYVFGNVIGK